MGSRIFKASSIIPQRQIQKRKDQVTPSLTGKGQILPSPSTPTRHSVTKRAERRISSDAYRAFPSQPWGQTPNPRECPRHPPNTASRAGFRQTHLHQGRCVQRRKSYRKEILVAGRALAAKAVLTVNRTNAPWLEGDCRLHSTFSANGFIPLPLVAAAATVSALGSPRRTATGASLRLVREASRRKEFLLSNSEGKGGSTVHTV